jgi:aminoglycoside/choline kinase family phosphotransferase
MNIENITRLFEQWAGEPSTKVTPLPLSGSDRIYYRIHSENKVALGVTNPDARENLAFIEFSNHFRRKGLHVPEIYAEIPTESIYLIEDLGDVTLFSFLTEEKKKNGFSANLISIYEQALTELIRFQVEASEGFNYSLCYPRGSFDKQSMMWDLSYFKYYFLKLARIPFDEQALEDDFQLFTDYLLQAPHDFFLYRDFQSRNIMLKDGKVFFIDYQGGRKGAMQYDVASLLYDAKAEIPQEIRNLLLDSYIRELRNHIEVDEQSFRQYFTAYVLIRIMQAMGAYGFRGFYEKKAHFLASIPPALENLRYILANLDLPIKLPSLTLVLHKLIDSEVLKEIGVDQKKLLVEVGSFSYKRGIPADDSGHGGGFVFDCRALPNPGRNPEFSTLTGKDLEVIEYLRREPEVTLFLENCIRLIDQSVQKYIERKFDHLSITFGCTGGQHRSVYSAEFISNYLKNKYGIKVITTHHEQNLNDSNSEL